MMQVMERLDLRSFPGHFAQLFSAANANKWKAFLAMALLARARIGPAAPFAAAYFAAGLRDNDSGPAMLAGCAAGAFLTGFEASALAAPAACALALMLHLLLETAAEKISVFSMDTPTRTALVAGMATLLPALAAAGWSPWMWLAGFACAVLAALLAPVIMAENVWWCAKLRYLSAAVAVVLSAAGFGLAPATVAALCAVAAACAGQGAFAGTVLGAVCMLCGGGAKALAAVCVMGAAADIAPPGRLSHIWRSVFAAAAYTAVPLAMNEAYDLLMPAAAALHTFIPPGIFDAISRRCAPPARRDTRLMTALRRRDELRLRALSDAFAGLSQACGAGDPAFGEQQLITRMRAA